MADVLRSLWAETWTCILLTRSSGDFDVYKFHSKWANPRQKSKEYVLDRTTDTKPARSESRVRTVPCTWDTWRKTLKTPCHTCFALRAKHTEAAVNGGQRETARVFHSRSILFWALPKQSTKILQQRNTRGEHVGLWTWEDKASSNSCLLLSGRGLIKYLSEKTILYVHVCDITLHRVRAQHPPPVPTTDPNHNSCWVSLLGVGRVGKEQEEEANHDPR